MSFAYNKLVEDAQEQQVELSLIQILVIGMTLFHLHHCCPLIIDVQIFK